MTSISGSLNGVDPRLIEMTQQAWNYVIPGATIEVTTGVSSHSPTNHAPGHAVDFRVRRPDGSTVMWDDPEAMQAAQFFRAQGGHGIGAGPTYMGGSHFHWDVSANGPRTWSDDDGGASDRGPGAAQWSNALADAERLGVGGLVAHYGAGIPDASQVDSMGGSLPPPVNYNPESYTPSGGGVYAGGGGGGYGGGYTPPWPSGGVNSLAAMPQSDPALNALAMTQQFRPQVNSLNAADFMTSRGVGQLLTIGIA